MFLFHFEELDNCQSIDYLRRFGYYYQGDRFIFFTDGLLEIKNHQGELLGEERLYQIFDACKDLEGKASCEFILQKLWDFSDGKTVEDDITLLIIDVD